MDYRHHDKPYTNLIANSGFGVWSNATISNVSPAIDIGGVTNGVAKAFAPSGSTIQSVTTGVLVRYGGTSIYEVTAISGGATMTLHDTSVNESGVSFYEFVPACVAGGALGPDGWDKDSTLDVYREHNGSNTKDGSFYAIKGVAGAAGDFVRWPKSTVRFLVEWKQKWAGRTVTAGIWALTSIASHLRIGIEDGISSIYSSYHSGGGSYEWLEVTYTVSTSLTQFFLEFRFDSNSDTGYYSQPMLIFGSSIGEGNYIPESDRFIYLDKKIISALFQDATGLSTVGAGTVMNLEADTEGKLPKNVEQVGLYALARDSGSAANVAQFMAENEASVEYFFVSPGGLTNDFWARNAGFVNCKPNGDYTYSINASGAGTFDFNDFRYTSVKWM